MLLEFTTTMLLMRLWLMVLLFFRDCSFIFTTNAPHLLALLPSHHVVGVEVKMKTSNRLWVRSSGVSIVQVMVLRESISIFEGYPVRETIPFSANCGGRLGLEVLRFSY